MRNGVDVTRTPIFFEIRRKLIHLLPLVIPLTSTFDLLQKKPLLIIVGISTVIAFWLDYARRRSGPVKVVFIRVFGSFLRKDETSTTIASTYYFTGMFLSIAFFPRPIAEASMYILIVGDTMAAIIGMGLGRMKFWGKSLEGSVAFFLSSCIMLTFLGRVDFRIWVVGVFVATVVEVLPLPFSDNLSIPISSGLSMCVVSHFI